MYFWPHNLSLELTLQEKRFTFYKNDRHQLQPKNKPRLEITKQGCFFDVFGKINFWEGLCNSYHC
jgi:hypothetical protein